jgi:hypothetical protein
MLFALPIADAAQRQQGAIQLRKISPAFILFTRGRPVMRCCERDVLSAFDPDLTEPAGIRGKVIEVGLDFSPAIAIR